MPAVRLEEFLVPAHQRHLSVNLKLVGSNCNMRCSYCYEHDEPRWATAPLDLAHVAALIDRIPSQTAVRFVLHGGEPLLYPKAMMRDLLRLIRERLPDRHEVQIQTNGTLLDEEWLEILAAAGPRFVVSVSLDPPGGERLRVLPQADAERVVRERIALVVRGGGPVGVVSVAHRANLRNFRPFLEELVGLGVPYLTINKQRYNVSERSAANRLAISEMEYVRLLEEVCSFWINSRLFMRVQIQPLLSLLSPDANRICVYDASPGKCHAFLALHPDGTVGGCDHLRSGPPAFLPACPTCPILGWCGGGCLGEERDADFCAARFRLKAFIERICQ
jgi:uncharacterized protein